MCILSREHILGHVYFRYTLTCLFWTHKDTYLHESAGVCMNLSALVSLCFCVLSTHDTYHACVCRDEHRSESKHVCMCVEAGAHVGVHRHTCTPECGDLDLHTLP